MTERLRKETNPAAVGIKGCDLKLGHALIFFGVEHRIASLTPYRHPTIDIPARIARDSQNWGMTVFDTDWVEVAS